MLPNFNKYLHLVIIGFIVSNLAKSETTTLPSPLLQIESFYTHHVLVAEKSTHLLHLYKNNNGLPELVKSYPMTTGKRTGDKLIEGDLKTPEGIYVFTDFMDHKELMQKAGSTGVIYGAGAFVMDYPNPIDDRLNKGGSGIWLHSTNDETRIDKGLDSRGCVVTGNADLIDVSLNIELFKTPIIVVQELVYLNSKTHETKRQELNKFISNWLDAWKNKDIEKYISHYSPLEFKDSKGNYQQYKAYKKAVFSNPGQPKIELTNIAILEAKGYAFISFSQKYQSNTINDTGKKTLYLKQDQNYEWKIVAELWSKNGLEGLLENKTFEPSQRFFKDGAKLDFSKKGN